VVLNDDLADELGLDPAWLRTSDGLAYLTGHAPDHPTYAQAYAGHQFGVYSPRLGDGRALLLEERRDARGTLWDVHLKGSGPTAFSRGGDGKAVIGPMLREYVVGEFLHAAGIPTTRALAVLTTGEQVWREGGPAPGAILVRVATGLVRVGTFQYAAARSPEILRRLADYAIARHYPQCAADDEPYLALYRSVLAAQASLVADWMAVGFVHGVMNTDNMVIAGESMDFGPCAFLDAFDTRAVFSSIDHSGRYAYGNQPPIAQWNLARFGEALLPLISQDPKDAVEPVTEALNGFAAMYEQEITARMAAKFGLPTGHQDLISDALELMQRHRVDYTGFFRALSQGSPGGLCAEPTAFDSWYARWQRVVGDPRHATGGIAPATDSARETAAGTPPEVAARMDRVNPLYIPRNHVVEEVLTAATAGDLSPLERLMGALRQPYEDQPGLEDLTRPAPSGSAPHVTFCGT
ncbi:MAG TPA: YdiU family protein, partial [Actinomycetales bacterium]|nr:YdiU family protein [Actinomycetales bacterium]